MTGIPGFQPPSTTIEQSTSPNEITTTVIGSAILDRILAAFDRDDVLLVRLIGPKGSGKTVLAKGFQRRLQEDGRLAGAVFNHDDMGTSGVFREIHAQLQQHQPGYKASWSALGLDVDQSSILDSSDAGALFKPFEHLPQTSAHDNRRVLIVDDSPSAWSQTEHFLRAYDACQSRPFLIFLATSDSSGNIPPGIPQVTLFLAQELPAVFSAYLAALKDTHPLGDTLASDWPSTEDIANLGERSLSSPRYGSIAIEYLSNINFRPDVRLRKLCESPSENAVQRMYLNMIDEAIAVPELPASGTYLACLYLYYVDTGRRTGGVDFFLNFLEISQADLTTWAQHLYPFLSYDAESDEFRFMDVRSAFAALKESRALEDNSRVPPIMAAHDKIAIACLRAIQTGKCKAEDSYPAIHLAAHYKEALGSPSLLQAVQDFSCSSFCQLEPSEDHMKERSLFWKLIPEFLDVVAATTRYGQDFANRESARLRQEFEDYVKDAVQLYSKNMFAASMLTWTVLEDDLRTYIRRVPEPREEKLMAEAYRNAKQRFFDSRQIRRKGKIDNLGLSDSILYHTSESQTHVDFLDILKAHTVLKESDYTQACLFIFSEFRSRCSPSRTIFVLDGDRGAPNLLDDTEFPYWLSMYYASRTLPKAKIEKSTAADITRRYQLPVIPENIDAEEFEPFVVDLARAVKNYMETFNHLVSEGKAEPMDIEVMPPRQGRRPKTPTEASASDVSSVRGDPKPHFPIKRPESQLSRRELPPAPANPANGRGSPTSGELEDSSPPIAQFDKTDRKNLHRGFRKEKDRRPAPPPLVIIPMPPREPKVAAGQPPEKPPLPPSNDSKKEKIKQKLTDESLDGFCGSNTCGPVACGCYCRCVIA